MGSGTTGRVVGRTRAIVHVPVPARPRTHGREGEGNQPKVSRRRAARGHQTPLAPAKDAESATAAPAEALMGTTIPARGRAPDRPLRTNLRWRPTVLACREKLACACRYESTNASQSTHMTPRHPPVASPAQVRAAVNNLSRCSHQKFAKTRLFTPQFTRINSLIRASG